MLVNFTFTGDSVLALCYHQKFRVVSLFPKMHQINSTTNS